MAPQLLDSPGQNSLLAERDVEMILRDLPVGKSLITPLMVAARDSCHRCSAASLFARRILALGKYLSEALLLADYHRAEAASRQLRQTAIHHQRIKLFPERHGHQAHKSFFVGGRRPIRSSRLI